MSRLAGITANPILTNFAQGAAQSAIKPVADFLAPTVPVPTQIGRFKKYTDKHRFKIPNTIRGLGGKATRIGFDAADATYNCTPNALDFPIDNLEQLEEAQLMNMAQYGATLISDSASLAHESLVLTTALAALGGGTASDFGDDTIDPIAVIDGIILAVIKAAKNGAPVKVLIGTGAWKKIKNNKNVKSRIVVGARNGLVAPSIADLSALLFANPEVMMSLMVQDTAAEGVAENISFLLDTKVIVFAGQSTPTTLDPSFMKTFRLNGAWMVPGSYVTEDQRGEVLKMDWSEDVQVTNATAGQLITT